MKSILNEEEIQKSIGKIEMYRNQENLILDEIKANFKNIGYIYNSSNTDSLEMKKNEIYKKMNTINKIHYNNSLVLQKNILKYKDTSKKVKKIFDNI